MNFEDFEDLKTFIGERIDSAVREQFKQTNTLIKDTHDDVNAGFGHLDDDRKDIAKIKVDHANIMQYFKELLDIFPRQTKRLVDALQSTATEAIGSATDAIKKETAPTVKDALDNYAQANKRPAENKRSFWKRFFTKNK